MTITVKKMLLHVNVHTIQQILHTKVNSQKKKKNVRMNMQHTQISKQYFIIQM